MGDWEIDTIVGKEKQLYAHGKAWYEKEDVSTSIGRHKATRRVQIARKDYNG